MSETLVDQLSLELIPGIGAKAARQLISYCGSAGEALKASKSQLLKIPGIGEKMAHALQNDTRRLEAEKILTDCVEQNINVIHYTSSA